MDYTVQVPPNKTNKNTIDLTQFEVPEAQDDHPVTMRRAIFTSEISASDTSGAFLYIEDCLKQTANIKLGSFLLGLLKASRIIGDSTNGDKVEYAEAETSVNRAVSDYNNYFNPSTGSFDRLRFNSEIIEVIGDDAIDEYPIIKIVLDVIMASRQKKKQMAEEVLIALQRVILIGIAKELK